MATLAFYDEGQPFDPTQVTPGVNALALSSLATHVTPAKPAPGNVFSIFAKLAKPYQFANLGLQPAAHPIKNFGAPTLGGALLKPETLPQDTESLVQEKVRVYNEGLYVDGVPFLVAFTAAGDKLVLSRPPQGRKRVYLLIVNDTAPGTIRVNLDAVAASGVGIPISAGGNLLQDNVVFQNDIHIYAPGAGNVQVTYANAIL